MERLPAHARPRGRRAARRAGTRSAASARRRRPTPPPGASRPDGRTEEPGHGAEEVAEVSVQIAPWKTEKGYAASSTTASSARSGGPVAACRRASRYRAASAAVKAVSDTSTPASTTARRGPTERVGQASHEEREGREEGDVLLSAVRGVVVIAAERDAEVPAAYHRANRLTSALPGTTKGAGCGNPNANTATIPIAATASREARAAGSTARSDSEARVGGTRGHASRRATAEGQCQWRTHAIATLTGGSEPECPSKGVPVPARAGTGQSRPPPARRASAPWRPRPRCARRRGDAAPGRGGRDVHAASSRAGSRARAPRGDPPSHQPCEAGGARAPVTGAASARATPANSPSTAR